MSTFLVSSRSEHLPGPPKKRHTRAQRRWYATLRYINGIFVLGGIFALTFSLVHTQLLFILLPVGVSLIVGLFASRSQLHNRYTLLLTLGVALIYYSVITGWELLTHGPTTSEIIVVTTTLATAALFEPGRAYLHALLEQRFHLRDDKTTRTIQAFTSTLRQEIELNGVREHFISVIQQTMQPQHISLWLLAPSSTTTDASDFATQSDEAIDTVVEVAEGDPFIAFALRQSGVLEVERLHLDSPIVRRLKSDETEIVLPLVSESELLGLLALGPRLNDQEYGREERRVLDTLAAHVSSALRVTYMVLAQQAQVREHDRIEQELRTARTIQHTFLPKEIPLLLGWHIEPYYQPAREVGGDFYDFLTFDDGRLGLVIGDVTGKGIPAALVMTATRTMLRTAAYENASPAEVLTRVNELLHADIPPGVFATCFYAVLDPASGLLRFANAGQDLPYLRHLDGSIAELHATGMPLGLMPGSQYDEGEATLAPGDCLLFYSDGLVEAHNPQREMFGLQRVANVMREHGNAATLITALLGSLRDFTGASWEQEDDVTLLTLHRQAHATTEIHAPTALATTES
ncbi:MAG: SpoIIE family protein phosphatase [Ktedonobacterales bacterium]